MDPQKGIRFGCFPLPERVALKKPRPSPMLPQLAGDVVILPWIRGGEPTLNISPQFVTCGTISLIPVCNGKVKEKLAFRFVLFACHLM
jgi:hypothetical protein